MEIEGEGEAKDREKIPAPKIKKIYKASDMNLCQNSWVDLFQLGQ
jgi:hypothetical protein